MATNLTLSLLYKSLVRMLLKQGYRHVYISRAFAKRNGFIPDDATPGYYGYTGLISIGAFFLFKSFTPLFVYLPVLNKLFSI